MHLELPEFTSSVLSLSFKESDCNLEMFLFVAADGLPLCNVLHSLPSNRRSTDNIKQLFLSMYCVNEMLFASLSDFLMWKYISAWKFVEGILVMGKEELHMFDHIGINNKCFLNYWW